MSERGCPFGCTYCVRTYGRRLISRSAESILSEIERLRSDHGIRNVRFMDDTFTLNRERLLRICQGLLDRDLRVAWTCLTRVDVLDRELLDLMRRSGCRRMYIGIESGSQRVLDYYKKNLTIVTIRRQMAVVKKSGLECSAFFIVGAPIETDADVDRSIALAKELDVDYVIVTKLQYWPDTELFTQARGIVSFDPFTSGELVYSVPGYEKARRWQRRFYRRFYLRPSYFLRRLRTLATSPADTLVGFGRLLSFLLQRQDWDDFI
jgi:anaerobic magnesium-protoporphyrin IX monomethyl ester cyclase